MNFCTAGKYRACAHCGDNFIFAKEMSAREVLYGALAGVGAFATSLAIYKGLHYLHARNKPVSTAHEKLNIEYQSEYMLKCFGALHYAAPEDYLLYDCVSRDSLGFHEKCANLCIKHKKVE